MATEYCSQYVPTRTSNIGGVVPKEKLQLWKNIGAANSTGSGGTRITETCPIHTKPKEQEVQQPVENKTPTTPSTNTAPAKTNTNTSTPAKPSTNTSKPTTNNTSQQQSKPSDSSQSSSGGNTTNTSDQ